MSRVKTLLALVSLCVTIASTTPVKSPPAGSGVTDLKTASGQLVKDLRDLATQAKSGKNVKSILKEALELQTDAADLIQILPGAVSQCETDLVIKMAAAGIGSHEVLTLLLADSELDVLNGRLSLSLAFLERVAQQLEDQLAISNDVGPQLAAIVFGTNATAQIAGSADVVVETIVALQGAADKDGNGARRDAQDVPLGNAWSLGQTGDLQWRSSLGLATVFLPSSGKDGVALKRGGGSLSVDPFYKSSKNYGVSAKYENDFANGRGNWHVSPSWSSGGGWGVSAGLTFNF